MNGTASAEIQDFVFMSFSLVALVAKATAYPSNKPHHVKEGIYNLSKLRCAGEGCGSGETDVGEKACGMIFNRA